MIEKSLILAPVILLAVAQVILKDQARIAGAAPDRIAYLKMLAISPALWGAMALAGAAFVAWMLVLQRYPLSQVYPVFSLSFPLVALLGHLFLGERVGTIQMIGLTMVVAGVCLCTRYQYAAP